VTVQASGPVAGDEVHKFTGKPEDAAIHLYYFNARYYDPVVGRFTSQDPAASGLNWYLYCSNRSLAYFDPSGLWEKDGKGGWIAEENDTLWSLAVIVYGDGTKWEQIPYTGDPKHLQVGERVLDPIVWEEIMDAVNDSQYTDYNSQHEEGGWIIDVANGGYKVMRWPSGEKMRIRSAPMQPGTVAGFHVHAVSAQQGGTYPPSPRDIAFVKVEAKHHYVLSPWNQTIYEISPTGVVLTSSDLSRSFRRALGKGEVRLE
jgi:RHS repeat-associated protein